MISNFPNAKIRFSGFFRLYTTDPDGNITKDTGVFHNLITDTGMDLIGSAPSQGISSSVQDFTAALCVGIGNAPPSTSDTVLASWLATVYDNSGSGCNVNTSYNAGPPAYWQGQRSFQFAAGSATGNIAEVGIGSAPTTSYSTNPLFSRALVVDGNGNPTVIPVLASEALTVTYILRQYIDLTDTNYSMSLSGTTYTGLFRRADVTTIPNLGISIGSYYASPQNFNYLYTGTIGNTSSVPTGEIDFINFGGSPYTPGTYTTSLSVTWDINHGNSTLGVASIMWTAVGAGSYQMSVSPVIPKTSAYAMVLNANFSWARYP